MKLSINDVNNRIEKIDDEINKLPITERQLINIQRKYNLSDKMYNYLLEKRAEAGIARASNIADNRILDQARIENVSLVRPKKKINYIIAIVIGLLVPFLFITISDYFNNKIIEKTDISKNTDAPILGTIGHSDYDSDISVFENPKSSLAESFRSIRTNLQYFSNINSSKIISISSIMSGEGKTFCAINLASVIAMSHKKTLLIGFDLRKPKIHSVFNVNNKSGLSTHLIGKSIGHLRKQLSKKWLKKLIGWIPSF